MRRWGVLGGGGIAPSHLIALRRIPFVEVVGVADIDPSARRRMAESFGVATYPSVEALLEQARPDAVTVALPPSLHLSAVELAAERGVHVLCEKPLAESVADCERMVARCCEAGIQLGAILNNRGYAQTRWIRALVETKGFVPRLVAARGALARSDRSPVATVFAIGIHYLDLMRWWLGEPERVGALWGEGVALGLLRFAEAVGELRLSTVGPTSAGVKVDLEGEEGRLTLGRHGIEIIEGTLGTPPPWEPEVEGMAFGRGHLTVIREAAEALERGEPFPVPGEEGAAAVALCAAIVRAAEGGHWEPVG